MAASYSRAEQETSIVFDEQDKTARIYTASPITIRKLDKLCKECPGAYTLVWEEVDGSAKRYSVPSKYIRYGKPASQARIASGKRVAATMASRRAEEDVT